MPWADEMARLRLARIPLHEMISMRLSLSSARIAAALAVGGLATAWGSAPALAANPPTRVGRAPSVPAGATAAGQLAADTELQLTVVMQPRDPGGLAAYATAVSTPGSSVYHRYLSVPQFVSKFGPLPSQLQQVEAALETQGLKVDSVSANQLAIQVDGTADQVERAFSLSLQRYVLPDGRKAFANSAPPALPTPVAQLVGGVLGLDSLAVPRPQDIQVQPSAPKPNTASANTTTTTTSAGLPQACAAAINTREYTAGQIASAYGLSGLYSAGDLGAGQTVGLVELERNISSDITTYQSCYGTSASVTYVSVAGGARSRQANDGAETELDIEDLLGLAPKASFTVYQAPDTSTGAYAAYNAIISANRAKVISTSWGMCEAFSGSAYAQSENTLFQEAATQGQSVFAASGDSGSQDCGGTGLAVDDPASQPYVTGVGGTTMSAVGPPPTQSVWNNGYGAGGGGISTLWTMPSYQSRAASALKVIGSLSSAGPCHATSGYCREVPDVSAAADPATGYAIYFNGGWIGEGGTSAAAPTWAAFATLANASSACAGAPIGFANPLLYQAASGAFSSDFSDVTTGTNGRYPAGSGYDMASGLGTPKGLALAGAMCGGEISSSAGVVTVTNPGSQSGRVGTAASLQIHASDSDGGTFAYRATGLPPGLSINSATGVISGTPSAAGTFNVTITAAAGSGASDSASFTWAISPNIVRTASITNPGPQRSRVRQSVSLQIHASDSDGGALTYSASGLPSGLSINSSTGLISGMPRATGTYTVTVRALDSTGPSASTSFTWSVTFS